MFFRNISCYFYVRPVKGFPVSRMTTQKIRPNAPVRGIPKLKKYCSHRIKPQTMNPGLVFPYSIEVIYFVSRYTQKSAQNVFSPFLSAIGGSTNVCSDVYSGKSAFSEAESRAVESFILNNNKDMIAYLTYHSYGEMWLYPWGYTSALPVDWQDLVCTHFST